MHSPQRDGEPDRNATRHIEMWRTGRQARADSRIDVCRIGQLVSDRSEEKRSFGDFCVYRLMRQVSDVTELVGELL